MNSRPVGKGNSEMERVRCNVEWLSKPGVERKKGIGECSKPW